MRPPYAAALGPAFGALPEPIRALHGETGPRAWSGRVRVRRGRRPRAALFAAVGRFPPAMEGAPFGLSIDPLPGGGERWTRDFGGHGTVSVVAWEGGRLTERFGPVEGETRLVPEPGGLRVELGAMRLAGIAVPKALRPLSRARVGADGERYLFDIAILTPGGHEAVRYDGFLERNGAGASGRPGPGPSDVGAELSLP